MLPILRILAPNPGVYTLEGTNTWIVGRDPSIVIDPGPDDPSHLDEVVLEAGQVALVLVTHDHPDHAPGALPFAGRVGAPVHAWRLPRWPLWLLTVLVLGAAIYLGLVLGGYVPVPPMLEGLAEFWWSRL